MNRSIDRLGVACCLGAAVTFASPDTGAQCATGGGLQVLSPADRSLTTSGSATVIAPVVNVHSADAKAISGSGSAMIDSPAINVAGGANFSGSSGHTGALNTGASPASDPLASLSAPVPGPDLGAATFGDGSFTVNPGTYSGGIRISGGHVTFRPGVYILDGEGLVVSGGGSINATNCLIFITGSGKLTLSGGSGATVTPPSSGPWAGVSFFQDRANTNKVAISGGSKINLQGAIYLPATKLAVISGSSAVDGEGPLVGTLFVADKVEVSGSGRIRIGGEVPCDDDDSLIEAMYD